MVVTEATKVAVIVGALLVSCGGLAVIDGPCPDAGTGGEGATASSSSTTSTSASSSSGESWGPPISPCVTCAEWIQTCQPDGTLCPDPASGCEGKSAELIKNLIMCICAGCHPICAGSCAMFDEVVGYDCCECQTYILQPTCGYEYGNCLMDE